MSDVMVARKPGRPTNAEREARATRLAVVEEETELTPILAQPRRWQLSDLDPWLLERLNFRWLAMEATWRGKLAGYAAGNEYLFITNGEAVLLAMNMRHAMSGKPVIMEVFAFCREANFKHDVYGLEDPQGAGAAALRALYRHLREWAKSMDATRVYVGICSDAVPSKLREMFADSYYVVGAPC